METNLPGRTAWETRQHQQDQGMHARLAAGLREAADYIETHPGLPIPLTAEVYYCIPAANDDDGFRKACDIAAQLGAAAVHRSVSSETHRDFGPVVSYRAVYVTKDSMAAWRALTSYDGSVKPAPAPESPAGRETTGAAA